MKIWTDWPPPPTDGLKDGVEASRSERPTVIGYWFEFARTHVRQEEVVPVGDEAEEEDERDDRLRERQRDPQERLQLAGAVHPRRVEQAGRKRSRVVDVGEVDAEREEREGQDHRQTLPIRCTLFSSRKIGSTSAAAGMIITTSVSERMSLRPGNLPKARP